MESRSLKSVNNHSKVTDRFLLNRSVFKIENSLLNLQYQNTTEARKKYLQTTSILKQELSHWKQKIYEKKLKHALNIEDEENQVLPFRMTNNNNGKKNNSKKRKLNFNQDDVHWPVKSRRVPILKSPFNVLELPNIKNDVCYNVIHWGQNNIIAAALCSTLYLWHMPTSTVQQVIRFEKEITAIKWSPNGSEIVIAFQKYGSLKVWNTGKQAVTAERYTTYCGNGLCHVTYIDYDPTGKVIVMGCDCGSIAITNTNLKPICRVLRAHHDGILKTLFSPDGKYIASTGFDSTVKIWTYCPLNLYFECSTYQPARGLCWHPWKNSYLCAGSIYGNLRLINVALKQIIHKVDIQPKSYLFDLTFNKITAELVTTHLIDSSINRSTVEPKSQVNVLSSFNTVVDRFTGYHGRVLYLQWSPNHDILATADSDETLQLWDFLPKSNKSSSQRMESIRKISVFKFEKYIR